MADQGGQVDSCVDSAAMFLKIFLPIYFNHSRSQSVSILWYLLSHV